MIYLAKGGFWLNLGQIISSLSGLLLSIVFANYVTKETFGIYKYTISIAGLLSLSTLSGLNTVIIQSVAQNKEGILKKSLKTKISWGFIGFALGVCFSLYYFYFKHDTYLSLSVLIAAIFIPFMDSFAIYDSFLVAKENFKKSSIYGIIIKTTSTIILISTIFISKNLFLLIFMYFTSYTIMRFFFLLVVIKKHKPNNDFDNSSITYGKHLSLINLITSIAQYLDSVLIFQFLGPAKLAIYSIAIAFPENIRNLMKFIQPLALVKFSSQNKETVYRDITRQMKKIGLIIFVIIILYIIFAKLIFILLMPLYKEAIFYSQLFSLSLFYFVIAIPISALQSQSEQKKLYKFYTVTSIFQIIVLLPGAIFFGITGVIIARIIARFFQIAFMLHILKSK